VNEAEDQSHGRGLARAVGAEEAGHPSGADLEGHVVDGDGVAVALGQALDLDHVASRLVVVRERTPGSGPRGA
jgi:hypothetical protein